MNKFLAVGCVAAVLTAMPVAAEAADVGPLPYRAPMALIYDWTGFYLGGHVGFISTDSDTGFIGGGQAGFNYQVGQWVFGVEGQMSATSIRNSAGGVITMNGVPVGAVGAEGSLDWISTLAGRAGFAFDRWLVYGKLGAAWAHGSGSFSVTGPGVGTSMSFSDTVSGWMLGVGTEYALRDNWSAKVEYNMLDFNHGTINVVKAGVNYRFNSFDPRRY
jgi:outer membrane immunogenic protein